MGNFFNVTQHYWNIHELNNVINNNRFSAEMVTACIFSVSNLFIIFLLFYILPKYFCSVIPWYQVQTLFFLQILSYGVK